MKRITVITVTAFLLLPGVAFAQEGEKHMKNHKQDVQMGKLHRMMPMYAQAQAKINDALEKGDASTVAKETRKILATIPDLKRAKPHKNLQELKAMGKIASAFEEDIRNTAALAKEKEFTKARVAFEKAQKRCNECHVKFR